MRTYRCLSRTAARPAIAPIVAFTLLACLSLLTSCAQDPIGIFASLAQERPIGEDSTKALGSSSPSSVARFSMDGQDYYFMASGYLYYRPLALAKDAWRQIPGLSGLPAEASRCVQMTCSDRIYAAWLDENFSFLGLYASDDAATWTQISPATPDIEDDVELLTRGGVSRDITGLFSLNGLVFAATRETGTEEGGSVTRFKLYSVSPGSDAAVACDFNLAYDPDHPYAATSIRSMTFDGGSYYLVSGSGIHSSPAGGALSFSRLSEEGMPTGMNLSSILWSPDLERLLVATGSGAFDAAPDDDSDVLTGGTPGLIFARLSDGSWESSAPSVLVSNPSTGGYANFTDLQVVYGSSARPVIVASASTTLKYGDGKTQSNKAAEARGYGILVPDDDKSISGHAAIASTVAIQAEISSWSNYETTMENLAVTRLFLLPGTENASVLFACTAGKGLWSDIVTALGDAFSWGGWVKE